MRDAKIAKRKLDNGCIRYTLQTEDGEVMKHAFMMNLIGLAFNEGYNITNLKEFLKQEKGEA